MSPGWRSATPRSCPPRSITGCRSAPVCPADPESKGGSEATVRVAKADLVPTDANLLPAYETFAELEEACAATMERFNSRVHAVTRRPPAEMLTVEREHLHPVPAEPYTVAFGESRTVSWSATVAFGGARYSVPSVLRDTRVWVRLAGDAVVIVADSPDGAREVARHRRQRPGGASILDEHYPPRRTDPLDRPAQATNPAEAAFLALGEGARRWLAEAAAVGLEGSRPAWPKRSVWPASSGTARLKKRWGWPPSPADSAPATSLPSSTPAETACGGLIRPCPSSPAPPAGPPSAPTATPSTQRPATRSSRDPPGRGPARRRSTVRGGPGRARGPMPPVAAALHPPRSHRRAARRQSPTLGTGRTAPGPVIGRDRGAGAFQHRSPPPGRPLPGRQNLRELGPVPVVDLPSHPTSAAFPGMGRPPRERRGVRAVGHREKSLHRSVGPSRHQRRAAGHLALRRGPRRPG